MNHNLTIALRVCALATAVLAAATPAQPETHVKIPATAAQSHDVATMEAIVQADYECISGGVGVPRQWGRASSLYNPNARSFVVQKDPKTGKLVPWAPTLQEYADHSDASLVAEGYVEREIAHKVYRFGNVATVFSSYEGKSASSGKLIARGVNIYQLYYDGDRWWISSVSWDAEHDITRIPEDLLPRT